MVAIFAATWREWRRRLRQLLRLRRKRMSFFIEFFCRFAGVGCPI